MTDWETAANAYAAELAKRPAALFVPPADTAWMAWATTLAALAGIFLIVWIAQRAPRVSGERKNARRAALAAIGPRLAPLNARAWKKEHQLALAIAVALGAIAGLVATGFHWGACSPGRYSDALRYCWPSLIWPVGGMIAGAAAIALPRLLRA